MDKVQQLSFLSTLFLQGTAAPLLEFFLLVNCMSLFLVTEVGGLAEVPYFSPVIRIRGGRLCQFCLLHTLSMYVYRLHFHGPFLIHYLLGALSCV